MASDTPKDAADTSAGTPNENDATTPDGETGAPQAADSGWQMPPDLDLASFGQDIPLDDAGINALLIEANARIEALTDELEEAKDQRLRITAEMENLRRRTEREIKNAGQYGITGFAKDMLTVSDNLRRALDAVSAEAREGADETIRTLLDGVDITERGLQQTFERHGISRYEPMGERMDPNLHEVLYEVEDPSVPAKTVMQIVEAGYQIGERVLRPAKVGVSRGGPKVAAEPKVEAAPEPVAEQGPGPDAAAAGEPAGSPETAGTEAPNSQNSNPGAHVNKTA
ncbi:MAG: nucleotide exchange factor GrpE [Pseudomonadota bacterium]